MKNRFSYPEDEGVEQQQRLQAEDRRFGFHPPGSHNPSETEGPKPELRSSFSLLSPQEEGNLSLTMTTAQPPLLVLPVTAQQSKLLMLYVISLPVLTSH